MVFRRDNKVDSFQRQISALRNQLGAEGEQDDEELEPGDESRRPRDDSPAGAYGFSDFPSSLQGSGSAVAIEEQPPAPSIPSIDAQSTVIAHDTTWKGEIDSQGTVHVNGRFEGSIRAKETVYIAEEADVDATINATTVIVAGLIKGSVRCTARFEALPTGRISGDVQAPALVVHEGATINGQFRMGSGESTGGQSNPTPVVQRRVTRGTA